MSTSLPKLPPLKPLSSFRSAPTNGITNLQSSSSSSSFSKTSIFFIPPWILDELSRIYSVAIRSSSSLKESKSSPKNNQQNNNHPNTQHHQFISKTLFPILLCGSKNEIMDGYNTSLFECSIVGGCISGISGSEEQQTFLEALFPASFTILKQISSYSDLEELFSPQKSPSIITKPLSENGFLTTRRRRNPTNNVIVYVPFYEKASSSSSSASIISVNIMNLPGETNINFQIPRTAYNPQTFTQQHVLPKLNDLLRDNNDQSNNSKTVIVTPTKVDLVLFDDNDDDDDLDFSVDERSKQSTKNKHLQQYHQAVEFLTSPTNSFPSATATSSSSSSKSQLQISLKYLPFQEVSLAKWEVFDLSTSSSPQLWSPFMAPAFPDSLRTFIHRVLLLPPCPYLSTPSMNLAVKNSLLLSMQKSEASPSALSESITKVPYSSSLLFFSKMMFASNKNRQLNDNNSVCFAFTRGEFDIYFAVNKNSMWDSTYLSIFTILSWFLKQDGYVSCPSLSSTMISNDAIRFFDSDGSNNNHEIDTTISPLHLKIQKILTRCDATKSDKFAESFVGTKSPIGAVEALLTLRYLLLNVTIRRADDNDEGAGDRKISNSQQLTSLLTKKIHDGDVPLGEPFEFRMVRFVIDNLDESESEFEDDDDDERSNDYNNFSRCLFPLSFIRMIVNHFDKSASPILIEIESARTKGRSNNGRMTTTKKQAFTIAGIEFDSTECSIVKNIPDVQKNHTSRRETRFFIIDHNDSERKQEPNWVTPSELLFPFLGVENGASKEKEEENIPASCVMIFPVVTGVTL